MISFKGRESKRGRIYKMSRNVERLYKEGKCRECKVIVTRMDFAKILGKFTKVKIQYESSSSPKAKTMDSNSSNTNSRLKCNENGMVLIRRNTYKQHPAKSLQSSKALQSPRASLSPKVLQSPQVLQSSKAILSPKDMQSPKALQSSKVLQSSKALQSPKVLQSPKFLQTSKTIQTTKALQNLRKSKGNEMPQESLMEPMRTVSNILKENNGVKKNLVIKEKNCDYDKKAVSSDLKHYGIVFTVPTISNNNNDIKGKISLIDLLPNLSKHILPSEEWCTDYFPKNDEPKDDKVYDRIAAELEDLMYNEKPIDKLKSEVTENKVEEFPSIMDILNDTAASTLKVNEHNTSEQFKSNLESSDVEAMLLGKSNVENKNLEPTSMEVDSTDVSKLIEDMDQLNNIADSSKSSKDKIEETSVKSDEKITEDVDNPHSPSILDEALQKGIEEHLPNDSHQKDISPEVSDVAKCKGNENDETISNNTVKPVIADVIIEDNSVPNNSVKKTMNQNDNSTVTIFNSGDVTHVVFKKITNGKCSKSVTCPKNLKYSIEIEEKSVEFIGAPKYISSLEDLQVLLQIVNESELDSLYVLH